MVNLLGFGCEPIWNFAFSPKKFHYSLRIPIFSKIQTKISSVFVLWIQINCKCHEFHCLISFFCVQFCIHSCYFCDSVHHDVVVAIDPRLCGSLSTAPYHSLFSFAFGVVHTSDWEKIQLFVPHPLLVCLCNEYLFNFIDLFCFFL